MSCLRRHAYIPISDDDLPPPKPLRNARLQRLISLSASMQSAIPPEQKSS